MERQESAGGRTHRPATRQVRAVPARTATHLRRLRSRVLNQGQGCLVGTVPCALRATDGCDRQPEAAVVVQLWSDLLWSADPAADCGLGAFDGQVSCAALF